MDQLQTIIILIVILIGFSIVYQQENFTWVKNIYGVGGTCNDYIPDYNSCGNPVPEYNYPNLENPFKIDSNVENFACPCSKRNISRPNITQAWEGFESTNKTGCGCGRGYGNCAYCQATDCPCRRGLDCPLARGRMCPYANNNY